MRKATTRAKPILSQLEAISIHPIAEGGQFHESNFVWGSKAARARLRGRLESLVSRSSAGTLSRREQEAFELFAGFLSDEFGTEISSPALVQFLSMTMDQLLAVAARSDRRFEGAKKFVGRPKSEVRPKSLRPNREATWKQSRFNYRDIANLVNLEVVTVKARMLKRFGSSGKKGRTRYFTLREVELEFGLHPAT